MSPPYRTPAPPPSPARPSWRRRLAATLPLPVAWRWVRVACGGAYTCVEFVEAYHRCGIAAHDRTRWRRAPYPDHEGARRWPDALRVVTEDHGPPVAPLRWTSSAWRRRVRWARVARGLRAGRAANV